MQVRTISAPAWHCGLFGLLMALESGVARAVEFDAGQLREGTAMDLQRFSQASLAPEGDFTLDITLNQQWKGRHRVTLRNAQGQRQASACYSLALLRDLGVDSQRLAGDVRDTLATQDACLPLQALKAGGTETLDFAELRLDLQLAQQVMSRQTSGYLSSEHWDSGVTAGFIDYRLNLYEQHNLQQQTQMRQGYLGLRAGLNTGAWYWRHEGSWQASDLAAPRYQAGNTSVRRDIPAWSSRLTLGDAYTRGDVFDSTTFRGVLLGSDERMLPPSQRGFSPVVSGVANSTALLSIRQRGVLIHESTVAPGPFEIDDLYASGLSDDLEVTLKEADGSERTFFVANQAAPLALRPGGSRFETSAGVWRDAFGQTGPAHVQGTWQYGLDNHLSLHGGGWLADDYLSSAMGVAINSGLGAVGLTHYHSRATLAQGPQAAGQAWRVSWRQRFEQWGTSLGASLTHSESPDYYRFDDFARASQGTRSYPTRWRAGLNMTQRLGERGGQLNASFSNSRSWAGRGSHDSYNIGYSNYIGSFSYGVNLRREQRTDGEPLQTLSVNVSMPLGEKRRSTVSAATSANSQGEGSSNVRWNASGGDRGQWGYGLAATRQEGTRDDAGVDANLMYRGASGDVSGSLSSRRNYRQATLGAQGAFVAHPGGVTAAPPLGESFAIVHAPGAANARIRQHPQVGLNGRGFAVVPHILPYELNTIDLDPKGMSRQVELQVAGQSVVPRAGAAAMLKYPTRSGMALVFQAFQKDGAALPFGALVHDEQGVEQGMVGQGSRVHARGGESQGKLKVVWGSAADEHCWLDYPVEQAGKLTAGACTAG